MSHPYSCPVCGRLTVKQLFDNVRITAEMNHQHRNVGGLMTFMCTELGHIFFVTKKDLETEPAKRAGGLTP